MIRLNKPWVVVSDTLDGGAATATNRLMDGLATLSAPAERWHFTPKARETKATEISLDPRLKRPPLERLLKNLSRSGANRLRHRRHEATFLRTVSERKPALLNLHNIHTCGLNHHTLSQLPPELPIVWTLHDCWPFRPEAFEWTNSATGLRETVCVDLPLHTALERRKQFLLQRPDVIWVAPSRWIGAELQRFAGSKVRLEHIPYGVDCDQFCPQPSQASRTALGLPPKKAWIGYSSTWVSTRKGTDVLAAALQKLDCKDLGLLAWGEPPAFEWPQGLTVRVVGRAEGYQTLRQLLSACDLFLCPSRADNLPNAVLESLACGTPVLGSRIGGIPDMVRPGQTGWLYEGDSPAACAAAVEQAVATPSAWPELRDQSRRVALDEFSVSVQARRYHSLFETISSQRP